VGGPARRAGTYRLEEIGEEESAAADGWPQRYRETGCLRLSECALKFADSVEQHRHFVIDRIPYDLELDAEGACAVLWFIA
jgi:hypothetical protein